MLIVFAIAVAIVASSAAKRLHGPATSRIVCVFVAMVGSLGGGAVLTLLTSGGTSVSPAGVVGAVGGCILAMHWCRALLETVASDDDATTEPPSRV
jgi:hypothetical protein